MPSMSHDTHQPATAQAMKPTDLLAYQPGAIATRMLIKQKCGTVTLFAFDAGTELKEHTAPFDALVNVVEGSAEISIAGRVNRVAPGEILILPANQPHSVRAATRFQMLLTIIRDPAPPKLNETAI